ncbi:unnamed protein product [Amoebophrya sp. A25]|nr:unnamed protein product [Amoebophrya sp. A25]|eukprot:GSA25T00014232001.1
MILGSVGEFVEIKVDLQTRKDLNALRGQITRTQELHENGRYAVQILMEDGSGNLVRDTHPHEATPVLLKPENLQLLEHYKREQAAAFDNTETVPLAAVEGDKSFDISTPLQVGDLVEMKGLRTRQDLNGRAGRVTQELNEKGRYTVQVLMKDDSASANLVKDARFEPKLLKPENLQLL